MSRFQKALLPFLLAALLAARPAGAEVTLHLYGYAGEPVDAVIDWGTEAGNAGCQRIVKGSGQSVTCGLTEPGVPVRISGTVPQFGPGALGTTGNTVSRVRSWGNVGLRSLDGAFRGNTRLTEVPVTVPGTVVNLNRTFQNATAFSQNLSGWGMAIKNVETMTDLFDGALAQATNLSQWCMRNFAEEPVGLMGRGAGRYASMRNAESKHPRYGECGISLPADLPGAAEMTIPFSFNLKSGLQVWSNAPAQTSVSLVTFEVVSGALPPGLTLNPLSGVISGTPTTAGEYAFKIRVHQN